MAEACVGGCRQAGQVALVACEAAGEHRVSFPVRRRIHDLLGHHAAADAECCALVLRIPVVDTQSADQLVALTKVAGQLAEQAVVAELCVRDARQVRVAVDHDAHGAAQAVAVGLIIEANRGIGRVVEAQSDCAARAPSFTPRFSRANFTPSMLRSA